MLQLLRKTKFSNLPLEFCRSMQRLWSTSKKTIFSQLPMTYCRDGLWTKVSGDAPKLATAQLPTVPQPCFSKMAAEDNRSCQSSSVYPYKDALDEVRGQPVLLCLSRRLCYLISKSIPFMIEFKVKQIRK